MSTPFLDSDSLSDIVVDDLTIPVAGRLVAKDRGCFCKGSNTTTSVQQPNPFFQQAYGNVVNQAQQVAAQPLQQYSGPLVAGFTPTQQNAFQTINNSQGLAQPYIQAGANLAANGTQPITPMQFSGANVAGYLSPFTQDVINSSMAGMGEANAEQQQQVIGNSIARGAFGGDRTGVAQSELARQQALAENQTIAGLENQAYTQGLGEFNAQQQMGVGAQEASQWLRENAGFELGNLGQLAQGTALSGAASQLSAGGLQQQLAQEQLNVPYEQFVQQQAYPFQTTNFLSGITEGIGGLAGGTSSTTPPAPNEFSQILGDVGTVAGIAALLNRGGRIRRDSGGNIPMSLPNIPDVSIDLFPNTDTGTHGGGLPPPPPPPQQQSQGSGISLGTIAQLASLAGANRGGRIHRDLGGGIPMSLPNIPDVSLTFIPSPGNRPHGGGPPAPPRPPQQDQGQGGAGIAGFGQLGRALNNNNLTPSQLDTYGNTVSPGTEQIVAAQAAMSADPLVQSEGFLRGGRIRRDGGGVIPGGAPVNFGSSSFANPTPTPSFAQVNQGMGNAMNRMMTDFPPAVLPTAGPSPVAGMTFGTGGTGGGGGGPITGVPANQVTPSNLIGNFSAPNPARAPAQTPASSSPSSSIPLNQIAVTPRGLLQLTPDQQAQSNALLAQQEQTQVPGTLTGQTLQAQQQLDNQIAAGYTTDLAGNLVPIGDVAAMNFGESRAQGGRIGYDDGGGIMPAGAYGAGQPVGMGNPQIGGMMQRFTQLPTEKLQELSVRMPPSSPQGQLVQRALMMKHMQPQAGQQPVMGAPQIAGAPTVAPPPQAMQAPTIQPLQPAMARGGRLRYDDGGDVYIPGEGSINVPVTPAPSPPADQRSAPYGYQTPIQQYVTGPISDWARAKGEDFAAAQRALNDPNAESAAGRALKFLTTPRPTYPPFESGYSEGAPPANVPPRETHGPDNYGAWPQQQPQVYTRDLPRPPPQKPLPTAVAQAPIGGGAQENLSGTAPGALNPNAGQPMQAPPATAPAGTSTYNAPSQEEAKLHSAYPNRSPWELLLALGAGMASSRSPYFSQALGEGAGSMLRTLQAGRAQEREEFNAEREAERWSKQLDISKGQLDRQSDYNAKQVAHWQDQLAEESRWHDLEHQGTMALRGIEGARLKLAQEEAARGTPTGYTQGDDGNTYRVYMDRSGRETRGTIPVVPENKYTDKTENLDKARQIISKDLFLSNPAINEAQWNQRLRQLGLDPNDFPFSAPAAGPPVGTRQQDAQGHWRVFKGGDPKDQKNWAVE